MDSRLKIAGMTRSRIAGMTSGRFLAEEARNDTTAEVEMDEAIYNLPNMMYVGTRTTLR
jgi:hypothetical protein